MGRIPAGQPPPRIGGITKPLTNVAISESEIAVSPVFAFPATPSETR
jgi:hypothetical protein